MSNKIKLITFAKLLNNFFDYMGRDKTPPNGRIESWYKKLKNYTEKDIINAFIFMQDNIDALPHNIPKAIKNAIFINNREKPQKKDLYFGSYGKCEECNGTGVFKLRIQHIDGLWYEPISYCGSCDNYQLWTNSPGERITKSELQSSGIMFKPYNKVLRKTIWKGDTGNAKNVSLIAQKIARKMHM